MTMQYACDKISEVLQKMVRFLNFISVLEDVATKDLLELENCVEQAIMEDKFIYDTCAPLINGGKRLRPVLFLLEVRI